jgi:hypothetical protein
MKYSKGTDFASALKYMYQNKYNIDTEELADCHSAFDVILLAETKAVGDKSSTLAGSFVEKINALGDIYAGNTSTSESKPTEKFVAKSSEPIVEEKHNSSEPTEFDRPSKNERKRNRDVDVVKEEPNA